MFFYLIIGCLACTGTMLRIPGNVYPEALGSLNSPPDAIASAGAATSFQGQSLGSGENYVAYRHWTNPGEPTEGTAPSYMMARRLAVKPIARCDFNHNVSTRSVATSNSLRKKKSDDFDTRSAVAPATATLNLFRKLEVEQAPHVVVDSSWKWAAELAAAIETIKATQMVNVARSSAAADLVEKLPPSPPKKKSRRRKEANTSTSTKILVRVKSVDDQPGFWHLATWVSSSANVTSPAEAECAPSSGKRPPPAKKKKTKHQSMQFVSALEPPAWTRVRRLQPKRPMTAFLLFSRQMRDELLAENDKFRSSQVRTKELAQRWVSQRR